MDSAGALPVAALPEVALGGGFDFLRNIRVIDLTTSVAGPYAAMLLGDLGADVIKIERPDGDDARAWGPPFLHEQSLWFLSVNRNKRSVCLDYSKAEGLQVLCELIAKADVVIVNTPARVARRLGIDAASLRALNPRLIYVSITGFGIDGERADWPCYDLIAEGYSGVMDLTGERDGEPQKVGTPAADLLAGQDAAFAALAALFRLGRADADCATGALIDIALVDSMTRFLSCRIVPFLGSGELPRRSGGKDSVICVYQAFRTADEPITLGLGNDNIWGRFWQALGKPEIGSDPRYGSNAQRRELRAEIVARIQEVLLTASREHWLERFREARIPSGPINRIDEVVCDEELQRRGMFFAVRTQAGLIPQVGTGMCIDGQINLPRRMPPRLGEHTEEVLRELACEPSRITDLKQRGVI